MTDTDRQSTTPPPYPIERCPTRSSQLVLAPAVKEEKGVRIASLLWMLGGTALGMMIMLLLVLPTIRNGHVEARVLSDIGSASAHISSRSVLDALHLGEVEAQNEENAEKGVAEAEESTGTLKEKRLAEKKALRKEKRRAKRAERKETAKKDALSNKASQSPLDLARKELREGDLGHAEVLFRKSLKTRRLTPQLTLVWAMSHFFEVPRPKQLLTSEKQQLRATAMPT